MTAAARLLRRGEWLLWRLGLLLIGIFSLAYLERTSFQFHQERVFEQELKTAKTAPETQPPPVRSFRPGEIIGRIEIPRTGLHAVVLEGTDDKTLRRAVGHIENTAFPGRPGNVGISAHRDTFFRGLSRLRVDDTIRLVTVDGVHDYLVESVMVVAPDDTSVLRPEAQPTLTLVTCFPFHYVGPAPKRYVVKARQVPRPRLVELPRSQPGGLGDRPQITSSRPRPHS